jgi:transposase-like protein
MRNTPGDSSPSNGNVIDITPLPREPEQDWRDNSLCSQIGSEIFFPEKGQPASDATKICARCEVQTECLEYSIETNQRFGVWGGKSTGQRDRYKKKHGTTVMTKEQEREQKRLERDAVIRDMLRTKRPIASIAHALGVGERAAYRLIDQFEKQREQEAS